MNKKVSIILIAVWSVIVVVCLIFMIALANGTKFVIMDFNLGNDKQMTFADKTYTSVDIENINIKVSSADVDFSQSDSDEIKVRITGYGSDKDKDLYKVAQSGKDIDVIQQKKRFGFWSFFTNKETHHIEIAIPASYSKNISATVVSGDINLKGDYILHTINICKTSGDFFSDSIKTDRATFTSVSGDIKINNLSGAYGINLTSGDVEIGRLSGNGSITAVSGDIKCDLASLSGNFNASSTSGDIDIRLESGISAKINANSVSGGITSNLPINYSGRGNHHGSAVVGNGENNKITISNVSGDIDIRKE